MKYTVEMVVDNSWTLSINGILAASVKDAIEKAKRDALHQMGYSNTKKFKARRECEAA
jgi:hypothetical protein